MTIEDIMSNHMDTYSKFLSILDDKIREYMIAKHLSMDDLKKHGERKIYQNKNYEEFFYKKELILTHNYDIVKGFGTIDIKWKGAKKL